jgi:hypothetical protein
MQAKSAGRRDTCPKNAWFRVGNAAQAGRGYPLYRVTRLEWHE